LSFISSWGNKSFFHLLIIHRAHCQIWLESKKFKALGLATYCNIHKPGWGTMIWCSRVFIIFNIRPHNQAQWKLRKVANKGHETQVEGSVIVPVHIANFPPAKIDPILLPKVIISNRKPKKKSRMLDSRTTLKQTSYDMTRCRRYFEGTYE